MTLGMVLSVGLSVGGSAALLLTGWIAVIFFCTHILDLQWMTPTDFGDYPDISCRQPAGESSHL